MLQAEPEDAQAMLQAEPEGEKPFYLKGSFYSEMLRGFLWACIGWLILIFIVSRKLPDVRKPSYAADDFFWRRAPLEDCKYPQYAFDFLAAVYSSHVPEVNNLFAMLNTRDPLPDYYLQTNLFFWHPDNAQYTGLTKWQHQVIRQLYQDASDKVKAQKETAKEAAEREAAEREAAEREAAEREAAEREAAEREAAERESGMEYDGTITKWYTTTTTIMDEPDKKMPKPFVSFYKSILAINTRE